MGLYLMVDFINWNANVSRGLMDIICFINWNAAVYIFRLGCPVRNMLDRDEDMVSSGTRHPFYGKYKVMFHMFVALIIIMCALFRYLNIWVY